MAEEVVFENGQIYNLEGLVTLTCIPSCITHRPLHTRQVSLKLKTICGRTDRRTFETGFIRSTLSKSRPKKVRNDGLHTGMLGLAVVNPRIKYEVSISSRYEGKKGDAKQ